MGWRKRFSHSPSPGSPRRGWRLVSCAVAILAVALLLFFGNGILAWCGRRVAAQQMDAGAISTAQQWLAWSARFDSDHGSTELMQAACFRQLQQMDRWHSALQLAEQEGAPTPQVKTERQLGSIQSGQLAEGAEAVLVELIEAGVPPHEVSTALVHGYLAHENSEMAKALLDAWSADHPDVAQVAYMTGVHQRWQGEQAGAESQFLDALGKQPRHELARAALAQLFEDQHRLDEALEQCVELSARFPTSVSARESLARILRKLGRLDEARAVLDSLASQSEPPSGVVVEMGQIEFASGNYEEAEQWFEQANLDPTKNGKTLSVAASAFALGQQISRGEQIFSQVEAAHDSVTRAYDLLVRASLAPGDREVAEELQRLYQTSRDSVSPRKQSIEEDRLGESAISGPELYAMHCGACHGANGDGQGRAARHLFPRPRDLRTGRARLVSTLSGVPTLEDVEEVIRRGMPGTSMQSFDSLSNEQIGLLAQEVLRLNQEGIREQFVNLLREEDEPIDEEEVRQVVEINTTPGEIAQVPQIGVGDPLAIARGKEVYSRLGCTNCHGDDGTGVNDTPLYDDRGRPTVPRDLAHDPFKGGQAPEAIYLRILLGMPGTPHPACYDISVDERTDLVQYCLSLSREPKRALTNRERATQADERAYLATYGRSSIP